MSREAVPPTAAAGGPRQRLGSWVLPAPEGTYGPLPAWSSAAAWFDAVMDALRTPEGEEARRAAKVAPDTLLRVAYADRAAATGRGVATAHETVAAALGMSAKTVQRSRQLLEALGLAVTVAEGRYLTTAERQEAQRRHGGHQVRAASTRALTMPAAARRTPPVDVAPERSRDVENVHLPSRRGVKRSSYLPDNSLTRTHSRALDATASRRRATDVQEGRNAVRRPRSIEVQRLAAGLVARMPRLARGGVHIGRLCDVIERFGLVDAGWTGAALLHEMDRRAQTLGLRLAPLAAQRSPLGYFTWILSTTIPEGTVAPSRSVQAERAARAAARAAAERAAAERRAQIEAEAEAIDAVIAQMRVRFPRRQMRHR